MKLFENSDDSSSKEKKSEKKSGKKDSKTDDNINDKIAKIMDTSTQQSIRDKHLQAIFKKADITYPELSYLLTYLNSCPKMNPNNSGNYSSSSIYYYNNSKATYKGPDIDTIRLYLKAHGSLSKITTDPIVFKKVREVLHFLSHPAYYLKFTEILQIFKDYNYTFETEDLEKYVKSFILTKPNLYNIGKNSHFVHHYITGLQDYLKIPEIQGDKLVVVEFFLFNSILHTKDVYSNNYRYGGTRDIITAIFKETGLDKDKSLKIPDTWIKEAYEKYYFIAIEILQKNYGLKPEIETIRKIVTDHKNGSNLYSYHRDYITDFLVKYFKTGNKKLSKTEFETFLLFDKSNADSLLKVLIQNNVLDLEEHSSIINDNFSLLDKQDTVKKLIDYGFVLEQKIGEKICKQRNLPLLRFLVDNYDLKLNQKCLENACYLRNNAQTINYIMEKGDVTPSAQCIKNYADSIGSTSLSSLVSKFIKGNGDCRDVQVVYSSDEE